MRRAKLLAIPGKAAGNRDVEWLDEHGIGAADPAENAASVVRSMFTHGSRSAIIGNDVTPCTVAAPLSGSPTTSATRAQSWRAARSFAMVMN